MGAKVLARAKAIQCNVGDIAQKADGEVVASVFGGGDFVCSVGLGKGGELVSECTCEAGCDCEHAAALVLAVVERLKAGRVMALIKEGDARLLRLDGEGQEKQRALSSAEKKVVAWMETLDARERLILLVDLLQKHAGVMHDLKQKCTMNGSTDRELLSQTKAAIKNVKESCDWRRGRGEEKPNYAPVRDCIAQLLERELVDSLPGLAEFLYTETEKLYHKIPRHIDDIQGGASKVMKMLVEAIHEGPLAREKVILWEYSMLKREETLMFSYGRYSKLMTASPLFWNHPKKVTPQVWSTVADALAAQLLATKEKYLYTEEELLEKACTNAERSNAFLDYKKKKASDSYDFRNVAGKMIKVGRLDEAEALSLRGVKKNDTTRDSHLEHLVQIAMMRGNVKMAASLAVERFIAEPSEEMYFDIQDVCKQAGYWEALRPTLLNFLMTGDCTECDKVERPMMPEVRFRGSKEGFPYYATLIRIAVKEKRLGDVLPLMDAYHEKCDRHKGPYSYQHDTQMLDDWVASKIESAYPERAYGLWDRGLKKTLGMSYEQAYDQVCSYVEQMHSVAKKIDRYSEWKALIARIRSTYGNRSLFMRKLDALMRQLKE